MYKIDGSVAAVRMAQAHASAEQGLMPKPPFMLIMGDTYPIDHTLLAECVTSLRNNPEKVRKEVHQTNMGTLDALVYAHKAAPEQLRMLEPVISQMGTRVVAFEVIGTALTVEGYLRKTPVTTIYFATGLASTFGLPDTEVRRNLRMPIFEITQEFTFDSTHYLPDRDGRPEYERLHGHSFVCEVTLGGTRIPELDWIVDLATFKAALDDVAGALDHRLLNDIDGLETSTMENMTEWIARQLSSWLRTLPSVDQNLEITSVKLMRPTIGQACTYRPNMKEVN